MKITKEFIRDILQRKTGLVLKEKTRKRNYINARAVYYELCREYTMESLSSIGGLLNKDHATVLHGRKVFSTLKMYEPNVYELYTYFRDKYPVDLYKGYKTEIIVERADEALLEKCKSLHEQLQQAKIDLSVARQNYDTLRDLKEDKFSAALHELTDEQKDIAYERFLAMVPMIKSYKVY